MQTSANFFLKKNFNFGLGLSGISSLNFLKKNNSVKFYDDNKNLIANLYQNFLSKR